MTAPTTTTATFTIPTPIDPDATDILDEIRDAHPTMWPYYRSHEITAADLCNVTYARDITINGNPATMTLTTEQIITGTVKYLHGNYSNYLTLTP